ncbi:MAG: hypothetical protein ACI4GW_01985 [Lachnospiraceae bacterium]
MDSSTKQDLKNKFAVIFMGIIFAVIGYGATYLVYLGETVDIMLILLTLMFGTVGLCLLVYGIYTLVTGKECKIVEDNHEKERELTEEQHQQIDMFVGEHGDKIEKFKDTVYTVNEIVSIIRDILLGLIFVATISVFAIAFDLISAIQQGDWLILIVFVIFMFIGLYNLIKGIVQLIRYIKKK